MVATIIFSIDELRDYAAKAGLGLNFVVKEAFLFELMEVLGEWDFVLKGGTAINKSYLAGHQRFSEDLDYDTEYTKADVKEKMTKLDWKVKKEFFTKNSIGFMMQYEFEGIRDVVRADISFGIKGASENRRVTSDFIPVSKRVNVYRFHELNRQKEAVFEERREWKDAYDLYWMHALYPSDFKIRERALFSKALSEIRVPKIANAYIPVQKRMNWDAVLGELGVLAREP